MLEGFKYSWGIPWHTCSPLLDTKTPQKVIRDALGEILGQASGNTQKLSQLPNFEHPPNLQIQYLLPR